ncbi:protein SCAI-like [Ylistrum balloti]|uniref:protein SCAI-like n=1 Tax=Ylistrum balloti TaxID=509963 RepID=UPI002905E882|nr:protein SCAI-like [Ylistrum balloti]
MSIADGSPLPAMDETEKKVVNEFCHLLEKSKQLFNGLRDLPQYGHKQWQSYFGRTFDVYTKLWKFQQQHRQILDTKYGLKRWQIGEVASKIGQLYYHYYLRTSETNYLNESFSFYSAIRMRVYYSKANKEERYGPDLMVKKLRYYARFIVVCLLLKKMKLVRDLVRELSKQIDDYTSTYEPEDKGEWRQVLDEIKAFIEADNIISVVDIDSSSIVLSHRLTPMNNTPLDPKGTPVYLSLQEILIVGNSSEQVKFSELTLDMFRMLQTLEREPQEDLSNQIYDASPAPGKPPFVRPHTYENGDRNNRRENPHKYLLYKPTFSQLNTFLASGFKELPPNGAMLLYISADGCLGNAKRNDDEMPLFVEMPLLVVKVLCSSSEMPLFVDKVLCSSSEMPLFVDKVLCSSSEMPLFVDKVLCSSSEMPLFVDKVLCSSSEMPLNAIVCRQSFVFILKMPLFVDKVLCSSSEMPLFVDKVLCSSSEMPLFVDKALCSSSEMPLFVDKVLCSSSEMPLFVDKVLCSSSEMPLFVDKVLCSSSEMPLFVDKALCSSSEMPLFVDKVLCSSSEMPLFVDKVLCSSSEMPLFVDKVLCSSSEMPLFVDKVLCSSSEMPLFVDKVLCSSSEMPLFVDKVLCSSSEMPLFVDKVLCSSSEMPFLHPGDVYPYCRKPMFLIIDSDNSSAFQNFPNLFGQPVVCLLSQEQVPTTMQDHQKGNLFTLFLHSPLMAFCYVCNINDIPITKWEKCQGQIDKFMSEASKLFLRSRSLDHSYLQFIGDDFLRLLMFRFVFCYIVLILHRGFKGPSYFPMSHPPLPTEEILEHPNLYKVVLDLATILNSRMQFAEPGEGDIHAT